MQPGAALPFHDVCTHCRCAAAPLDIKSAKGKRIYWIHGALDWMFPVRLTQGASEALTMIVADITLRVVDCLSHTYPREENDRILKWFEPGLAVPEQNGKWGQIFHKEGCRMD